MNQTIAQLQTRFDALEVRERLALAALSAFVFVVLLYFVVWLPVHNYAADGRLDYDRHLKLWTYLKSTEAEARSAAKGGNTDRRRGQSLLTSVSRDAQSVGIKPSRMQPEGSDAVSVWFDDVTFTDLMLWLERLEAQRGIGVKQVSIDQQDDPGQVSARLQLTAG